MDVTHSTADGQEALWNGPAGCAWVETQEVLDPMFKPFEDLLVEAVPAGSGSHVLDVGCGAGTTTFAVARRLGAGGRSVGIDISAPLIAAAQARAEGARAEQDGSSVSFIRANAQTHAFEPASFDLILSRFGVMFFDDPIQAFRNLRRAARKGARIRFVAWWSAAENPFMTTAERAAAPFLPNLHARRPDAPGQFAFADHHRVHAILKETGWGEIDILPIDMACTLPEKELVRYLSRLGPVGQVLRETDDETRRRVLGAVRAAFDPYVHGAEVRFTAACWRVRACATPETTDAKSNPELVNEALRRNLDNPPV